MNSNSLDPSQPFVPPVSDPTSHTDSPLLPSAITIPGLGSTSLIPQNVPDALLSSDQNAFVNSTSISSDTEDSEGSGATVAAPTDVMVADENGVQPGLVVQNGMITRNSQIEDQHQDSDETSSGSSATVVDAFQEQDASMADDEDVKIKFHLQSEMLQHHNKVENDHQAVPKDLTARSDMATKLLPQADTLGTKTNPEHTHMSIRSDNESQFDRGREPVTIKSEDRASLSLISHDLNFLEAAATQREDPGAEWEYDSSDAEALAAQGDASLNSSNSSNTSDESDLEDEDGVQLLTNEEMLEKLNAEDGDDEEGHRGAGKSGAKSVGPTTQNEQPRPAVEKITKVLTPEMKISDLGSVEHILEQGAQQEQTIDLIVKTSAADVDCVLEIGSVVCTEDRKVVGAISEAFGPVRSPFYMVPMHSMAVVKELDLREGMKLFYVNEDAVMILTEPLQKIKGSDASNLYDEEIGEHEMEFSDDEAEAEYKRMMKDSKAKRKGVDIAGGPPRRTRPNGNVPPTSSKNEQTGYPLGGINYDEPSRDEMGSGNRDDALTDAGNKTVNEEDETIGYNRLLRPADLHMMAPRDTLTNVRRRGQLINGRGFVNGTMSRQGLDHGHSQHRLPPLTKGQRGDSRGGSRGARGGRARGHADIARHDGRDRAARVERAAGRGDRSGGPGDSGYNQVNLASHAPSRPSIVLTPHNDPHRRGSHGTHSQRPPYGATHDSMPRVEVSTPADGGGGGSTQLPYETFHAGHPQSGPLHNGLYQGMQFNDGQSRGGPYITGHRQTGPINGRMSHNGGFANGSGSFSGPSNYGSGNLGSIPPVQASAGAIQQYGGAYPYAGGLHAGHGFIYSPAPTAINYPNSGNIAAGYYGGKMNTFGGMSNQVYPNQQSPVSNYNPNTNYSGLPASFGGTPNGYPGGQGNFFAKAHTPHAGFNNVNNHPPAATALPPGTFLNPDMARHGPHGYPHHQAPR